MWVFYYLERNVSSNPFPLFHWTQYKCSIVFWKQQNLCAAFIAEDCLSFGRVHCVAVHNFYWHDCSIKSASHSIQNRSPKHAKHTFLFTKHETYFALDPLVLRTLVGADSGEMLVSSISAMYLHNFILDAKTHEEYCTKTDRWNFI